ncbi:hypothetical protein FQZ97_766400 [compost metagenome]
MPHQRRAGAQGLARADRITGVVRRRRAPVAARRLRVVLRTHRLVALESTSPQHHATSGLDSQEHAITNHFSADDPAVFLDQALQPAVERERYLAVHQRAAQCGDQGVAQGEEAVAPGTQAPAQVAPVAPEHPQGQPDPAGAPA